MRDLGPREAAALVKQRMDAATGLTPEDLEAMDDTDGVDVDAATMLRMVLSDVVQPRDMEQLITEAIPGMAQGVLTTVVPLVLATASITDDDGEQVQATLAVKLSEDVWATTAAAVGKHVAIGLLMRREGDPRAEA